jgi:sugar phosphate isomerase/epimerase
MQSSFNARAVGLTLSASETIEIAAETGFDAVDLMVRDLVDAGETPEGLRLRMNDLGVKGGSFPLPVSWRGDETTFRRDLAALRHHAETAAQLGLVGTGTWVCPEIPDHLDGPRGFADTVAIHLDRLGPIAETLTSYGLSLALEVIGPERSRTGRTPRFITRLGELSPIAEPLSRIGRIGVLLDSFHLYAADETLDDALAPGLPAPTWVHLADLPTGAPADRRQIDDAVRGLPGDHGAIDNASILRRLRDEGYTGPVTVEPLSRCASLTGLDARATARAVSRALQSIWPS